MAGQMCCIVLLPAPLGLEREGFLLTCGPLFSPSCFDGVAMRSSSSIRSQEEQGNRSNTSSMLLLLQFTEFTCPAVSYRYVYHWVLAWWENSAAIPSRRLQKGNQRMVFCDCSTESQVFAGIGEYRMIFPLVFNYGIVQVKSASVINQGIFRKRAFKFSDSKSWSSPLTYI